MISRITKVRNRRLSSLSIQVPGYRCLVEGFLLHSYGLLEMGIPREYHSHKAKHGELSKRRNRLHA